ncbi:hypothetical protein ESY86_07805 [Subsaximicrobium wynnwilliamsii]|uniref:Uncharacterized protein n=1 Tax=Subsaximicrobium wynnwilliamsii TaxID=291179 RepID=A0A5C6ZIU7_9FLAO|nr:hypothetical protein [Subsaximicrobium wynnwilliamsii]TXD83936.1 hypothetical protein ESY87_07970 [Subsaximicrobium wynnwilliamsii]TXD89676.1 hypothetical protein ESY86_07805 [Subsaximicrobium wynnwilliamsii]TXE01661.1 hypothetical protein ESY88_14870 [Subsaximicrobium wynnwilliamsii]
MRTVNPQEIAQLYQFTRAHFVEYYDLQTELVDHLANDMEVIWQKQPKLSFEQARDASFKKFGVFGFMDVVGERQKAMTKRYMTYLWQEFRQWLTLPKLAITLCLFLVFYTAFSSPFVPLFLVLVFGYHAVWSIYKSVILRKRFKSRRENTSKKWMLEEMIFKQAGGAALLLMSQLPTWYNLSGAYLSNPTLVIGISLFTTVFSIYMYVSFELLPNKAEELLNQTYPEYSM